MRKRRITRIHYHYHRSQILQLIEQITTDADQLQEQTLAEILSRNAEAEYLQRRGLNGRTDRQSFKKLIPVITYEDIRKDIRRIANGDKSPILCSQSITELITRIYICCSSGTSGGERKLIPLTEDEFERRGFPRTLSSTVKDQFFKDLDEGKVMLFLFVRSGATTPGGLPAHPFSTSAIKRMQPKISTSDSNNITSNNTMTSPIETFACLDYYQSMYAQLLCGLYQSREVNRIGAIFGSTLLRTIKFLEKYWSKLCYDIRTGTLNSEITDTKVREAVMRILKPDPNLADFIEKECNKTSWHGILRKLWPNTKYIDTIVTGTMSQYVSSIDYYSGCIPIVCSHYASSESYFGINLNPFCKPCDVAYTFLPSSAYFEFLPVNKNNNSITNCADAEDQLVELVDVKLGKEYEVVVTNFAGLYRYKIGDILRVAGFKNKTPQFNFVCRENVVLSIDTDKTGEVELQNAISNVENHLMPFNVMLIDYTSFADTCSVPGHYILYWEFNTNYSSTSMPDSIFEECCYIIEESLNSVYRQGRNENLIGPLEIKIVETGTFDRLMDEAIRNGASIAQYKTPRCLKLSSMVELLNSRVVSYYFSTKMPSWVPGVRTMD